MFAEGALDFLCRLSSRTTEEKKRGYSDFIVEKELQVALFQFLN
ncbi:lambda family phage holin [Desmospora sp. 8437]|nr:lambda family phage holin [Desmospora sp. 8437]